MLFGKHLREGGKQDEEGWEPSEDVVSSMILRGLQPKSYASGGKGPGSYIPTLFPSS